MTTDPRPHERAFEALNHSPLSSTPTPDQRRELAAILDEADLPPNDVEVYLRPHLSSSGDVTVLLGARLTTSPDDDDDQPKGTLYERVVELRPNGSRYNDYRVKTEDD